MSTPTRKAAGNNSRPYRVFRQGFLLIPRGGVRKRLHRYWFVLFEQKDLLAFLFFKDEDHFLEKKKNEGFIRIDDATSIDVMPEYMGRKNAFCIATPRNKNVIVSESRYELHQWIFALHNALEEFRGQNTLQKKKKEGGASRQRANSTSASSANNNKTPPRIKPSRPAPPVPQNKRRSDSELPGGGNTQEENQEPSPYHHHGQQQEEVVLTSPTTSPLDAIVAGLLAETREINTMDYNLTEEEQLQDEEEEHQSLDLTNGTTTVTFSSSLPVLNVGTGGSQSPSEHTSEEGELNIAESYEELGQRSTTIPLDGRSKKRASKKRNSIKGPRSVSPPNIPPPPPPGNEQEGQDQYHQVFESLIDSALNEITAEINNTMTKSTKPRPTPPKRVSSLSPKVERKDNQSPQENEVKNYLEEAFQKEDQRELSSPETPEESEEVKQRKVSTGILRQHDSVERDKKRTVMFQDELEKRRDSPSYEPRIDKEDDVPLSVMEAKKKLNQETQVAKFRKNEITKSKGAESVKENEDEITDELVKSIEHVLESTSYMETPPETRKSFVAIVGGDETDYEAPPTTAVRYMLSSDVAQNQVGVSPPPPINEAWAGANGHPNGTGETFDSSMQNPIYRSLV